MLCKSLYTQQALTKVTKHHTDYAIQVARQYIYIYIYVVITKHHTGYVCTTLGNIHTGMLCYTSS